MPSEGQASASRDAAATKRLKKREIDRRCQREARQRTKSRIAYLESLVEELRRKDTSGQVASLMQQVSEARKERDMFARTLRGIEESIRSHRTTLGGGPPKEEPADQRNEEHHRNPVEDEERPATTFPDPTFSSPTFPSPIFPTPSHSVAGAWERPSTKPVSNSASTGGADSEIPSSRATDVEPRVPAWMAAPGRMQYGPPAPPMFPGDANGCECCERLSPQEVSNSTAIEMAQRNIWQFAHTVLDKPPSLTPKVLRWEDDNSDDVPVRAISEGWPAVETRLGGHLPPIWKKLRRIDEVVFGDLPFVERLAILRVMHWLMRYHADPTTQRARIPPWYLAR